MNWGIAGHIITAASFLFVAISYLLDRNREKKHKTIEKISSLIEDYHNHIADTSLSDNYREHVRFLSELDRFAIAVSERVYSKGQIKKIRKQVS